MGGWVGERVGGWDVYLAHEEDLEAPGLVALRFGGGPTFFRGAVYI